MENIQFTKNLVKGRIAETVFAQMLRHSGEFTVLEFGYEKIIPELVQSGDRQENEMIETLRTAPDFAVINRKTKEVHLIEVKYRKVMESKYILEIAKRMHQSWNPSYLFVATLGGFYFDKIDEIIKSNGDIAPLKHPQIPAEIQTEYLKIIQEFESGK
jgi:hypothetical protein